MRIQPSMTIISLAVLLVSPVQAVKKQSASAASSGAPMALRGVLAQLEAPVGHRQPTLDDLPEWLREEEKPGAEASPAPEAGTADVDQEDQRHVQRQKSRIRPDDGVPRICDPC